MQHKLVPARAFPPGIILQKEIEARGLTEEELVALDENLAQTIGDIIQGKQHISPEIAENLSAIFETSAESWVNLENNYRLYLKNKAINQATDSYNLD